MLQHLNLHAKAMSELQQMSQTWVGSVAFVGSGEFMSEEMQIHLFCECTM